MADKVMPAALTEGTLQRVFRSYAFFLQQTVRRSAEYMRDVGDLTRSGSIEPRLWAGRLEKMWSGLTDDFGESLAIATATDGNGDARKGFLPLLEFVQDKSRTVKTLDLEVPRWAFASSTTHGLALSTSGLWREETRMFVPERHLHFSYFNASSVVSRESPRAKLHLFDLQCDIPSGLTVSGVVMATVAKEQGPPPVQPFPVLVVRVRFD